MSKPSKACSYTGHMKIMNRNNQTKEVRDAQQAKMLHQHQMLEKHPKHKTEYPEVLAEQRSQKKCSCKA